ncbi:hypothetical protein AVEN_212976-1 [Araneus ventricosus]|uniref:Uncharacterized protein n=1 Tax=Araneus ventricosus TaxID=182803 RepID=A0A4Y2MG44_ARAVE|nr:hypothetical protein AVEN_212976-1 [Araneus ventricosus]
MSAKFGSNVLLLVCGCLEKVRVKCSLVGVWMLGESSGQMFSCWCVDVWRKFVSNVLLLVCGCLEEVRVKCSLVGAWMFGEGGSGQTGTLSVNEFVPKFDTGLQFWYKDHVANFIYFSVTVFRLLCLQAV